MASLMTGGLKKIYGVYRSNYTGVIIEGEGSSSGTVSAGGPAASQSWSRAHRLAQWQRRRRPLKLSDNDAILCIGYSAHIRGRIHPVDLSLSSLLGMRALAGPRTIMPREREASTKRQRERGGGAQTRRERLTDRLSGRRRRR